MKTVDQVIKTAFFSAMGVSASKADDKFNEVLAKNSLTKERLGKYLTDGTYLNEKYPLDDFSLKALKFHNAI